MKNASKKLLIILFLLAYSTNGFSQETTKYDYAEIVVFQKTKKKTSEYKSIYLNSSSDSSLNASEIMEITNNASLLQYMNENNWEYVERLGSQPSLSEPIWINYIFRKKK